MAQKKKRLALLTASLFFYLLFSNIAVLFLCNDAGIAAGSL
jgi:hypothetical protein